MKTSRKGIVISAAPSLLMLGLFYSLAVHMHRGLGGWPTGIDEQGFPASLVTHEYATVYWFIVLIWFGMFCWPTAMLFSLAVPQWRRLAPYFAIYALVFLACWGIMQLAPEPFLDWWGD